MRNASVRKQHHSHNARTNARAGKTVKRWLVGILIALTSILALLALKAWLPLWPEWLGHYRPVFVAIFLYSDTFLAAMTPIIIAYKNDPRPLSGPGKNPEMGNWQ